MNPAFLRKSIIIMVILLKINTSPIFCKKRMPEFMQKKSKDNRHRTYT